MRRVGAGPAGRVVVGLSASAALVGCGSRQAPVEVVYAQVSPADAARLEVGAGACHREPYRVRVTETSLEVRISLVARSYHGSAEAACSDGVIVHLRQPLGSRVVVDAATGASVRVFRP